MRRGVVIYIVLFVLFIVAILALSLNRLVSNVSFQVRKLHNVIKLDLFLRSAIAWSIGKIQEDLEKLDSSLFRYFISDKLAPGQELDFDRQYLYDLADQAKVRLDLRVIVTEVAPLAKQALNESYCGYDSAQRICRLKFIVHAVSAEEEATLEEFREIKIINLLPGIFGKFSLFIRDAGRTDFNLFANTINGWPDSSARSSILPVVIFNGEELDNGIDPWLERDTHESFQKRGFIYLGGGKVSLNLTAGDDERYGESFHFFRADQFASLRSPRPIAYYPSSPPSFFAIAPPVLSTEHPQNDSSGGFLNPVPPFSPYFTYYIKRMIYGFFTSDTNGMNMNNEQQLVRTFPNSPPSGYDPRMRSSCLHLFGTSICPSPTLVLGQVYRRYVDYSSVIMDATGLNSDGTVRRDAFLGFVCEIPSDLSFESLPFTNQVQAAKGGDLPVGTPIVLPQNVNWQKMFVSESQYKEHQCKIVEEPYLRSHDFICFRSDDSFFPQRSCFGTTEAVPQETFSLALHQSLNRNEMFFNNGDLDDLKYSHLTAKAVYKVRSFKEFLSRFVTDGKLVLNTVVQVVGVQNEHYTLPPVTLERGGILLLDKGNLSISSIRSSGGRPTDILAIALGEGDIILETGSNFEPIQAFLMAFNGTIRNRSAYPLRVRGGILVNTYLPYEFPKGGKIEYNSAADPSNTLYPTFYRVLVSDIEPPSNSEVEGRK